MFFKAFHLRNEQVTDTSYRLSYSIALVGESTIAKVLVELYTAGTPKCLLDGKSVKEITALPFSNNAGIHRFNGKYKY